MRDVDCKAYKQGCNDVLRHGGHRLSEGNTWILGEKPTASTKKAARVQSGSHRLDLEDDGKGFYITYHVS